MIRTSIIKNCFKRLSKINLHIWVIAVITFTNNTKGERLLSKNKVIKSVSFNVTNEHDKECLEFIESINFSGYVKELIFADIRKRKQALKIVHKSENGGIKIVVGQ